MATRSTIALEFADGTIGQVYCHFNGYLNNNGRILQQHYSDPFQLRSLIDRGDMSQLGNTVDQCDFYGNEGARARYFTDFQDYFEQGQLEEYNYILRQVNGKPAWLVNCYLSDDEFVTIDRAAELSSLGA
jgi:hypothetical protein